MSRRRWSLPRPGSSPWPLVALALIVVAGTVLRVGVLRTSIGRLDGDEGVTGVMAQRILTGDLPLFFGNQNYQGAFEQYLQAGTLALLPDSPFTLRLVQVALSAVVLVLTYMLGSRVCRSPWAGVLAAGLLAFGPYYFVVKGVKSHGGYDSAIVFGLLALLLALALRRMSSRAPLIGAALGLSAGLALWANPTAIYLVLPAALWAVGSMRGSFRRLLAPTAAGFVAGVVPYAVRALHTGSLTPSRTDAQPPTTYLDRLKRFFDPVLGDFLGAGNANPAIAPGLPTRALAIAMVLGVLIAAWHRRYGVRDLLTMRTGQRKPVDAIIIGLLAIPFIYAASPFTWFLGEPRYMFTAYPLAAVAATAAIFTLRLTVTRGAIAAFAILAIAFLTGWSLSEAHKAGGTLAGIKLGVIYTEDAPMVARTLRAEGVRAAYTNYWMAGPLQFASGNALSIAAGAWTQFPAIEAEVRQTRAPAIVVPTEPGAGLVRTELQRTGRTFTESVAGRFTAFTAISPAYHPGAQGLPLDVR